MGCHPSNNIRETESEREREREANATWSTSSFTSYHGQLLSLAVQWGVAIKIERAIKRQDERPLLLKNRRVRRGALEALGPGSPGVLNQRTLG